MLPQAEARPINCPLPSAGIRSSSDNSAASELSDSLIECDRGQPSDRPARVADPIAGGVWALAAVGSLLLQQPVLSAVLGVLATFVVFVGYIWAAFDPRKQAWHDKLVGTVVVRTS